MDRAEHIMRMRRTGDLVIPLIRRAYERAASGSTLLANAMARFLVRRTKEHQPLLRPYFVRLGYEVCGGTDIATVAPALAAAEIFNISTYQANLAFDGKLEVVSSQDCAEQFACAMISRELACSELRELPSSSQAEQLLSSLSTVSDAIYRGQLIDLRELNLGFPARLTDLAGLRKLYVERCTQLGGYFTRWCFTAGAVLAGAPESLVDRIGAIGLQMGIAGQMVNDVGDLVPLDCASENPRYQQPFSDLLNGKITLPLLCALEANDSASLSLAQRAMGGHDAFAPEVRSLVQHLNASGAFAQARRCVSDYARNCSKSVRCLPPSAARRYLAMSISTLTHNKYFTFLRLTRPSLVSSLNDTQERSAYEQ